MVSPWQPMLSAQATRRYTLAEPYNCSSALRANGGSVPTRIIYEGDIFESHTKYYSLNNNNPKLPDEVKAFLPLPSGLYILHFYYKGQIVSHKLIVR